jgi:hypothetical protein
VKEYLLSLLPLLLVSSASATISYQQSAAMWNQSGTTCVVSFGMNTSANNLIAVWTSWQSSSTFTASAADGVNEHNGPFPTAGGPTLQSNTTPATTAQIFYARKIAGGADTVTVTFTGTGTVSSSNCVIVEYSGLDWYNPLDSASAGYSTTGNPTILLDSGNVNPANSNLLVFGAGFADQNLGLAAGTGFTKLQYANGTWGTGLVEDNSAGISGNNVLQRATECIASALGSCGTTPGDWLMQIAVFRDASWTVQGGWSPARYGAAQPLYADQFPGIDIGDKINKATAALPTKGAVPYAYDATSYTSGSSVTFTETGGTASDTVRYICVGY